MSSRLLTDLDSRFEPIAELVIADCLAADVPVTVICTLRSIAEQEDDVRRGVSWTLKGKHLPQPPQGKSLAIDLCPTELLILAAKPGATEYQREWSPAHPDWWVIARSGVARGLRSGMDWHQVGLPPVGVTRPDWDGGHLEMLVD